MQTLSTQPRNPTPIRNVVLVVLAATMLGTAGWLGYGHVRSTSGTGVAGDATVSVRCPNCRATWDMPFADYDAESTAALQSGENGIRCIACGSSGAWKAPGSAVSNLPEVAISADAAPDAADGSGPENRRRGPRKSDDDKVPEFEAVP